MSNKTLITVLYLSLLSIAIGLFGLLLDNSRLDIFLRVGEIFFTVVGIYLLIVNGEFVKSRDFKTARIGIAVLILGVLFKILHLRGADQLIGLGLIIIPALYLIYMFRNKRTEWRNYLKFLFVLTLFSSKYFLILHAAYASELSIASTVLLVFLVFDFIIRNRASVNEDQT